MSSSSHPAAAAGGGSAPSMEAQLRELAGAAQAKARDSGEEVARAAEELQAKAQRQAKVARAQAASAWSDVRDLVRRHPMAVLALLFAAVLLGMAVGSSALAAAVMGKVQLRPLTCIAERSGAQSLPPPSASDPPPPLHLSRPLSSLRSPPLGTRGSHRSTARTRRWRRSCARPSSAPHSAAQRNAPSTHRRRRPPLTAATLCGRIAVSL